MFRQDIVVDKVNPHPDGDDVIIGDIHGNSQGLEEVLKTLGPYDRLILVGDLVDRGPDSYGVIRKIIATNRKQELDGKPPKILAIRGNHEDIILDLVRTMLKADPSSRKEYVTKHHLSNGCGWVADLEEHQLKELQDYLESLPYIIHFKSPIDSPYEPYNIVHADLPFEGAELLRRIEQNNFKLENTQVTHAVWARDNGRDPPRKKAGDYPHLTFSGHDIGDGLRATTKHVNLDVESYYTSCALTVRYKAKKCELIGTKNNKCAILPGVRLDSAAAVGAELEPLMQREREMQEARKVYLAKSKEQKLAEDFNYLLSLKKAAGEFLSELPDGSECTNELETLQGILNGMDKNPTQEHLNKARGLLKANLPKDNIVKEQDYSKIVEKLTDEKNRLSKELDKYSHKNNKKAGTKRIEILNNRIQTLEKSINTLQSLRSIKDPRTNQPIDMLTYPVLITLLTRIKAEMHSTRKHAGWGFFQFIAGAVQGQKVIEKLIRDLTSSAEQNKHGFHPPKMRF